MVVPNINRGKGKFDMYTFTFTAEEIRDAMEAKNKRARESGNMMEAHRTHVALNSGDPHSESEMRALLLEQDSPNPEYTGSLKSIG